MFINIGEEKPYPSTNGGVGLTGYYINDLNYILNEQLRICFKLSKTPPNGTDPATYEKNSANE